MNGWSFSYKIQWFLCTKPTMSYSWYFQSYSTLYTVVFCIAIPDKLCLILNDLRSLQFCEHNKKIYKYCRQFSIFLSTKYFVFTILWYFSSLFFFQLCFHCLNFSIFNLSRRTYSKVQNGWRGFWPLWMYIFPWGGHEKTHKYGNYSNLLYPSLFIFSILCCIFLGRFKPNMII